MNNDSCQLLGFTSIPEPLNSRCCFCFDDFSEGEKVCRVACGHLFHLLCINSWFDRGQQSCPICRREVHTLPFRPNSRIISSAFLVCFIAADWFRLTSENFAPNPGLDYTLLVGTFASSVWFIANQEMENIMDELGPL